MTRPLILRMTGTGPLSRRVYRGLRDAVHRGVLAPGERLPSTRQLAQDLDVSRTTVVSAYDQLLAEGYVEGRVGSGTYVAPELPRLSRKSRAASRKSARAPRLSAYARRALELGALRPRETTRPKYDFFYGAPSMEDFPQEIWLRLLSRCARSASHEAFQYGAAGGDPSLRAEIAAYLARARGVRCRPEQVLVVNGSQQALDLSARVLLEPGDPVVIEEPHYQGARHVFRAAGAKLLPVPVDAAGIEVARLGRAAERARLAYVTPSHQFPIGVTMSFSRRQALLAWAERTGAYLLEDDYDSEYRYEGRPIESLQGLDETGVVIYTGTFSKVLYPALRVGYMVLPERLVEPFERAKWLTDRHTPTLEQRALARFLSEEHFERYLRRARTRNAARRAALLDALTRYFGECVEVQGENAGIHLVAWFPEMGRAAFERALTCARDAGLGVQPVAPYYLGTPPGHGLVLGFSCLGERRIAQGVRALARVFDA